MPKVESSDSEDIPLHRTPATARVNGAGSTMKNGKRQLPSSDADEAVNGTPAPKKQRRSSRSSHGARTTAKSEERPGRKRKKVESSSSGDEPLASPTKRIPVKAILPSANGRAVASGVPSAVKTAATTSAPNPSSDDDDLPLSARVKNKNKAISPKRESPMPADVPFPETVINPKPRRRATKKVKKDSDDDSSGDDAKRKISRSKKKVKKGPDDEDLKPSTSKAPQTPRSQSVKQKFKKEEPESPKKSKGEEEEEELYRWWEQGAVEDGSKKWTTLEHNGILFPPLYQPLPPHVKLLYSGREVDLPPESEEVAGFFAAMLNTEHAKDLVFQKNFFHDFLEVLKRHPPRNKIKIAEFDKCDFSTMAQWFEEEREKARALPASAKKQLKEEKAKLEEKYVYCTLDGRKEKVGNFRAEPPGLFRGRGEHPKKGALKLRLSPEDITLNIGKGVPIPTPNVPGEWGKIIHDDTVTWLVHWKENVNGNLKYVFLAAGSSLKGQSDMQKFEKARELKKHVDLIRADYTNSLTSKLMIDRQLATALYLIDRLALRAGNEKGEDEADTVGCCSLRYEHITLEPPDRLCFDFLGKDSIRYVNTVSVDPQVYKNIRLFKKPPKTIGDAVFDRVSPNQINKYLTGWMSGLSAKVFRTFNASITFQDQLSNRTPKDASVVEKIAAYNEANRQVAILCNHQKAVNKNHDSNMEKLGNQIRAIKYQRRKLRYALFKISSKYKTDPRYAEDESDIDDEWIAEYEDESREKEIEKATKKWEKDNEKAEAEGEPSIPKDNLISKIDQINEEYDRLKTERGTAHAELKKSQSEAQVIAAIDKLDERIKTAKVKRQDRDNLKEVSLGTSKINYLDPRITVAWCKGNGVPVEKLFTKSLITKFPWAMAVDSDWKF
ncbi:uncharacterized protein EI90DRAFT_2965361 [Cantharellus anzutake]|uniref:uncharacterized protein n=1 Tax=Cantharellus anzutake TaxID=1750568 RepID=UPI0019032AE0|nr:uncharacterized protein EI90DRAFT_2965361 [Cantharellus anzutake]KAF8342258.1 hypothetical protein EI90DRAFT_2965361 [Cantharellus anzutake]